MTKTGGGLCDFLKKLREIKSSHKKAQEFYKTLIFLHPHLKYIPIEQCPDYKHALKLKFHLSFLLGQAIIKADKAWFKGGYLKLNDYIKEAKKTFREFKEYENEVDSFVLALIFENKAQILLKDKNLKEALIDLLNSLNLNQKEVFVRNLLKWVENLDFTLNLNSGLNSGLKNSNLNSSLSQNSNKKLNSSTNLNQALNSNSNLNKTLNSNSSKQNPIQQAFQNESFRKDLGLFLKDFLNLLQDFKDYEALNETLKHNLSFNFAFIYENLSSIKTWLSSSEFKEKFHNHPYPSLLNPEKIEYESISAELAWDLNLPLRANKYKYIFFLFGVSGHGSVWFFCNLLNIRAAGMNLDVNFKGSIQRLYDDIQGAFLYSAVWFFRNSRERYIKQAYLCQDVPFIILCRDPIERLTSGVNHGGMAHGKKYNDKFYLFTNPKEVLNRKVFRTLDGKIVNYPVIEVMEIFIKQSAENFFYTSLASICKREVDYLDCSEIMPDKVIDTFKNASFFKGEFDLNLLDKHKARLTQINGGNFAGNLPLTMKADEFEIYIDKKHSILSEHLDLCKEFFDENLEILNLVSFQMTQSEFEKLKQNAKLFKQVKEYLKDFTKELWNVYNKADASRFSNEQILEYLKENKHLALELKSVLDKELVHIKKTRPDIVASWKYYKEFEKMCAELDG